MHVDEAGMPCCTLTPHDQLHQQPHHVRPLPVTLALHTNRSGMQEPGFRKSAQELLSPAPKGIATAIWPALTMQCMQAPCRPLQAPTHLIHPDAPQQRVLQQRKAQAQHLAVVHIGIRLKHLQRAMVGRGCHG